LGSNACKADQAQASPALSLFGNGLTGSMASVNTIHPDGLYSEGLRAPAYRARRNMGDGVHGGLSFWVKPGAETGLTGRHSIWLNLRRCNADPVATLAENSSGYSAFPICQSFAVGRSLSSSARMGLLLETRPAKSDDHAQGGGVEGGTFFNPAQTFWHPRRWHLVTAQWNLAGIQDSEHNILYLNATPHTPGSSFPYYGFAPYGGLFESFTQDGFDEAGTFGPTWFHLGTSGNNVLLRGSDATLDELLFLTFSGNTMAEAGVFASDRFASGRYHKEDEALDPATPQYRSCPIPLGKGARVLRVDWTLLLPRSELSISPADLWPPPNRILFGTGDDLTAGETADAAISLLDAGGAPLLPARLTQCGTPVNLVPPAGVFRLGVNIRPRLGDNTGNWQKVAAPVLESPAFDDITFTYVGPDGPRLAAWSEED
jgi:hypothetical protein